MNNWKEPGDGEYTRILDDGAVAKVFEQPFMWRAAVDERSRKLTELRELEALSFALGLASGVRWRGRKPKADALR